MKLFLSLITLLFFSIAVSAQNPLKKPGGLLNKASSILNNNASSDLTSNEIVAGLKEALVIGAGNRKENAPDRYGKISG